jgi:hypothetical protein
MKPNTVLIAIDPCIMEGTGTPALTVGKSYVTFGGASLSMFKIINDQGEEHSFSEDEHFPIYFRKLSPNEHGIIITGFITKEQAQEFANYLKAEHIFVF